MQAIGLCRFSYPAIGGFQVGHDSIEERIRYLYQPDRIEERFRLFETVALPGLRAQTRQNFDLIIVIGDSLSAPHRDRLHDLTADMPQVRIVVQPPRRHREVMKEVLNAARRNPDKPCLQFRFDDDDAVAVDFIERMRQAVRDCDGLIRKNKTVAIDYNRGFIARLGADGIAAEEVVRPFATPALGMYVQGGCKQTIMNFAHTKIGRFMPVVSFTDAPMWLRSHNRYNDSPQVKAKPVELSPLTPGQEGEFATRFAIDADQVCRVFAAS
ncbi:putative rhamnosyl transferase [Ruegeria sp. HKCCD8929]|uniref:putative rhamnosyl transferase n=1 Tax=Ruegeria sp. HKCCD8929 TaxID=2683006 RepID=UPI0014887F03|nr:putative rhamnosyl transferase [Ruegeria sp. HKCCD8929]